MITLFIRTISCIIFDICCIVFILWFIYDATSFKSIEQKFWTLFYNIYLTLWCYSLQKFIFITRNIEVFLLFDFWWFHMFLFRDINRKTLTYIYKQKYDIIGLQTFINFFEIYYSLMFYFNELGCIVFFKYQNLNFSCVIRLLLLI